MTRSRPWAFVALVACGCSDPDPLPPRGQLVLHVATDAVLPPADGAAPDPPSSPQALFDRMTIELFSPGALEPCAGCRRELAIDREQFAGPGPSLGVVPSTGAAGHRVRVRLFRGSAVRDGEPIPIDTLEATAALPPIAAEGIVEATLFLAVDDVGVPRGTLEAPVAVEPGQGATGRVGTWPRARRVDCAAPPAPGEVCVPGGAFWMGDVHLNGAAQDGDAERLVALSPFYLDATEVTVGALRAAGFSAHAWSGVVDGGSDADFCTFTASASPNDPRAVNCVTWDVARAYCNARGGDLPTEAQWEYAARALSGLPYAWGLDPPGCADAVWGRGYGAYFPGSVGFLPPTCPLPEGIAGAVEPGTGARDALELPTGTIVDLAGNVREWTLDRYNTQAEPCWAGRPLLVDPACDVDGAIAGARSVRGDGFFQPAIVLPGAARSFERHDIELSFNGFRCARAAEPGP